MAFDNLLKKVMRLLTPMKILASVVEVEKKG